MSVLIHAADLHISRAEQAYSLAVLDELIEAAAREKAAALLFAGDLFDSPADMDALRPALRRALDRLPPNIEVIYLPGNHENAGGRDFAARDFGRARVPTGLPFELWSLADFEVLCLAQRGSYADYPGWQVPAKRLPRRVALAHATVSGLSFAGAEDDDEPAGIIDPDLFDRFEADYAALGHIHSGRQARPGRCLLAYPGSARVWRVKPQEAGPRRALKVSLGAAVELEPIVLAAAGELLLLELPVSPEGEIEGLEEALAGLGSNDHASVKLTGMVENERLLKDKLEAARRRHESRLRRLDFDQDGVLVIEGISETPLVRAFLAAWKNRGAADMNEAERRVWLEARRAGLAALTEAGGAKR